MTREDLRPAVLTAFGLLVTAHLAVTVFLLWEPPFDGSIRYDDVRPIADSYWPMNVLLGGPGFALSAVTGAVFLAILGRGSRLALAGATLYLVAGIVFALVITAEVLPFAWAVDDAGGRALFDVYNERLDDFLPYVLAPMAATALGALLATTGAALAGGLPRWAPGVVLLIIVGVFAVPPGGLLTVAVDLAQRAFWIYLGWQGLRATRA